MRKRMLRSVLVAAFFAVVAAGTLGGPAVAKGDTRADSIWSVTVASAVPVSEGATVGTDDSIWS